MPAVDPPKIGQSRPRSAWRLRRAPGQGGRRLAGSFPPEAFCVIEYSSLGRPRSLESSTKVSMRFFASARRPEWAYRSTSQIEHASHQDLSGNWADTLSGL